MHPRCAVGILTGREPDTTISAMYRGLSQHSTILRLQYYAMSITALHAHPAAAPLAAAYPPAAAPAPADPRWLLQSLPS